MSSYAHLACLDCKISRLLGKVVARAGSQVDYFHLGAATEPLNWQRSQLNQVVWKMLADHSGHQLRVITSWDPAFELLADFTMIGGPDADDISVEDYLQDWGGLNEIEHPATHTASSNGDET
jgi:hypothetical protein